MATTVYARVNRDTLRFIRETRRVSYEYIQRITKFTQERIQLWESGEEDKWPTINQAKALAKCYHIPFAGFYMERANINVKNIPALRNFRTFQSAVIDDTAVNLAIIDLLNARDFFIDSKKALNEPTVTFDMYIVGGDSVVGWAEEIRKFLGVTIEEQYRCRSPRQLFLLVRKRLEEKGIFVQGFTGVEPEVLRGVAIVDGLMPIIGINDNDRPPAKTFSMIHELVHIIKRTSSVCNDMTTTASGGSEEVFCNAVAGEFLVPSYIVKTEQAGKDDLDFDLEDVDKLAKRFSVSSEVIARRLLDCEICSDDWYRKTSAALTKRYNDSREESRELRKAGLSNGLPRNMTREAIDRTSTALCETLLHGYSEGYFDKADVSRAIGIGEKHIGKFVGEVLKWYL